MAAIRFLRGALLGVLVACSQLAYAQQAPITLETPTADLSPEQFAKLMAGTNRIGVGVLGQPSFPGSSGETILPLPDIDVTYQNRFFANMEDGAGVYFYNDGTLSFGASGFARLGRDQNSDIRLLGLGNISNTPQGRAISEYDLGWLDVKGTIAHDFWGSNGTTFEGKIGTALPLSNQFVLVPAVKTVFADHDYMQVWYGVSPLQSLASGKPAFNAHAGFESVGTTVDALFRFAPNLALVGRGGLSYLTSNVARSPVVEHRVQPTFGFGLSYLFN